MYTFLYICVYLQLIEGICNRRAPAWRQPSAGCGNPAPRPRLPSSAGASEPVMLGTSAVPYATCFPLSLAALTFLLGGEALFAIENTGSASKPVRLSARAFFLEKKLFRRTGLLEPLEPNTGNFQCSSRNFIDLFDQVRPAIVIRSGMSCAAHEEKYRAVNYTKKSSVQFEDVRNLRQIRSSWRFRNFGSVPVISFQEFRSLSLYSQPPATSFLLRLGPSSPET